MKTKIKLFFIILALLLLLSLGGYLIFQSPLINFLGLESSDEESFLEKQVQMLPEEYETIDYEDYEGFFTVPGQDDLVEEGLLTYVRDELIVDVDIYDFDESIFEIYDGYIVGYSDFLESYQVRFPGYSLEDLESLAEIFKADQGVIDARVNYILPRKVEDFSYPNDKIKIPELFGKTYDKNSLWQGYNKEAGFENSYLDEKSFNKNNFTSNPYWGYQATNLPYLWDITNRDEKIKITVMDSAFTFTNIADVDMENLDLTSVFDERDALKKDNIDIDPEGNLEKFGKAKLPWEMSKKEINKTKKEYKNSSADHVYKVSSTAGAKANDLGFTGTALNTKLMTMPYINNLEPYLISYSLGQNREGLPDIINISMGYDDIILYCINADPERFKEDLSNKKFRKDLKIDKMFTDKGTIFNRPFSKKRYEDDLDQVYQSLVTYKKAYEASEKSLARGLEKLLDKKDFVIVYAAGNSNAIIQKLENTYGLDVDHTTYFHYASDRLRDHIIVVGASKPKFSEYGRGIESYFANFSTRKNVDIVAPGTNMPGYNTYGDFILWQGTSSAAPFVSGVIANLCSQAESISGPEIKKLIVDSGNLPVNDEDGIEDSRLIDCKKLAENIKTEEKIIIEADKNDFNDFSGEEDFQIDESEYLGYLLESFYGVWRDIDNSYVKGNQVRDYRMALDENEIYLYNFASCDQRWGEYEILSYDLQNQSIKLKVWEKFTMLNEYFLEDTEFYLDKYKNKNLKIYEFFKDQPGPPLTIDELRQRPEVPGGDPLILEYEEIYTLRLINDLQMLIEHEGEETHYIYLCDFDDDGDYSLY